MHVAHNDLLGSPWISLDLLGGSNGGWHQCPRPCSTAARGSACAYRHRVPARVPMMQKQEELEKIYAADAESGRRWTASKWLASRNVSSLVADALQLPPLSANEHSQFSYVRGLSRQRVEKLLGVAKLEGLCDFIMAAIEDLQSQATGSAEHLNEKFSTTAKFQMTYGSLSLFYGGLESLLGPPKMYKGATHAERSLYNMMEFEHTGEKDSLEEFVAPNGVTSKAEIEWEVVCSPSKDASQYPERQGYRDSHPTWCRVPKALAEMLELMEAQCNSKLRAGGHSEMILEELVGGRLCECRASISLRAAFR